MATSPETQPSLLVKIRDQGDSESWSRFVGIYTPVIYAFLKQQSLQEADALDLTQDVMASVAEAIRSFDYQPQKGRFRGWLFTVVQNRLRNFWRNSAGRPAARGDSQTYLRLLETADERNDAAEKWNREYEHRLFISAAEMVRPRVHESTWQAFWSTVVESDSPAKVGKRLGMSAAAVRLAKARVIARIKHEIRSLEGEET